MALRYKEFHLKLSLTFWWRTCNRFQRIHTLKKEENRRLGVLIDCIHMPYNVIWVGRKNYNIMTPVAKLVKETVGKMEEIAIFIFTSCFLVHFIDLIAIFCQWTLLLDVLHQNFKFVFCCLFGATDENFYGHDTFAPKYDLLIRTCHMFCFILIFEFAGGSD